MIRDGRTVPPGTMLATDVAIVGGGPVGIVLALTLAEAGSSVLLLESGGAAREAASEALNAAEVADPAHHPPAHRFRRRGLGGASALWGGRTAPYDPMDFGPRPWIAPEGWPITAAALAPYVAAARAWCEAGSDVAMPAMAPILPGFAGRFITDRSFERFSCPTDFGRRYRARLAASPRLTVVLHATVTRIETDPAGQRVMALRVHTASGPCRVRARRVVLAAGGLETPRLLLASGLGGAHDQVGRYYMSHLAGTTARFTPAPGAPVWHGYAVGQDGVFWRRRFALRHAAQRAHRTGNFVARLHHPRIGDPAHGSGALSLLHLARPFMAWEYARRLEGGGAARHVWNVLADAPAAAGFGAMMIRRRVLADRKFPSIVVHPRHGPYSLDIHAEQAPNFESRVTLGEARDALGMPRLRIAWRHAAIDLHTVRLGVAALAADIAASGVGTLDYDADAVCADVLGEGAYGGHHIGTARMAASPRHGVVDAEGRVFGMANLYVAGCAAMPTSGAANPTLTAIALALRLAAHLAVPPAGLALFPLDRRSRRREAAAVASL